MQSPETTNMFHHNDKNYLYLKFKQKTKRKMNS